MPMPTSLQITTAAADPALLDLPWAVASWDWPAETIAALPRGISRHTVRFVRLSGRVIAIKEIGETAAYREYELLRDLNRLDVPSVRPVGVVTGRSSPEGEPLTPALVTEHLRFSLPYRALFSRHLAPDTATRLIDALAVLLVRLHLVGFFWGDVSLSNTLFRRDAGEFAAYLVDAETGELHDQLTDGQRGHDLEIARVNIIGELMDLAAGDLLMDDVDPIAIGEMIVERHTDLWSTLTEMQEFATDDRWRVADRIRRLNALRYDVGELVMTTDVDGTSVRIQPKVVDVMPRIHHFGTSVRIQPKVVDAGPHHRRLMRLTGLDVQENQARRLLNDIDTYRAATDRQGDDEVYVAHDWLAEVFEPTVRAVPRELSRKLEPADLFHEVLEHRWYLAQNRGEDVSMPQAVESYIDSVLRHRPDEDAVLGGPPPEPTEPVD